MLDALERICAGEGRPEDLDILNELSDAVQKGSLCGLGRAAPNPVRATLRYFMEEYQAHIADHACPAGVCKPLFHYEIDPDRCDGCDACARACSHDAIEGNGSGPHAIDLETCVKCGECYHVCPLKAVVVA